MSRPTIAIIGGGVAGLSCAHELRSKDVEVVVYDAAHAVGGKARSHYVAGTGTEGRRDLPGEHGFRFYPSFYLHLTEAMREIPDPLSPTGHVAGNLTGAPDAGIAVPHAGMLVSPRRPRSLDDLKLSMKAFSTVGATVKDVSRYVMAHLQWLTSCEARRDDELEHLPWARFIGIDVPGLYSESFRQVLLSTSRTMVAMDASSSSTRTMGLASSLLILDTLDATHEVDRTMMGPTSECWLDPWQRHLEANGVRFELGLRAQALELAPDGQSIRRALLRTAAGEPVTVEADVFVLALPLEAVVALTSDALAKASPVLEALRSINLSRTLSWMTGVQLYLSEDLPLVRGHSFFPGSAWSLTAISQAQFWAGGQRAVERYGDGRLRGILSIDVSSCETPDEDGVRLIDETSKESIIKRVIRQLGQSLDSPTAKQLERSVYAAHLDDELQVGPNGVTNSARLLIHPPGSRFTRPNTESGLGNLLLAGDYVRTEVDLASMEGANESGRHAAAHALGRLGLDASGIRFFKHQPLTRFKAMQKLDALAWRLGKPHVFDLAKSLFD